MAKLSPKFIDLESITLLSTAKIFSVIDFLEADTEKIVMNSKMTLEKVLQLKNEFVKQFSCCPAKELDISSLQTNRLFIKTHIEGLDKLLCGGLLKGSILELCGPSGCGKTQICHSIAVNCAVNSVSVEIIDTKDDFSATRCNILLPSGLSDEKMDEILEQINVYHTTDIYELISVLKKIHSNLKQNNGKDKIIIIDSITVPYLPFVGVSSCRGFRLLNFIVSSMKEMIAEYNVAIILTNLGVIYNENGEHTNKNIEVKPLMGKYWEHIPNTRIIVTRDSETNKRRLMLYKSDYMSNKTETINISESGTS